MEYRSVKEMSTTWGLSPRRLQEFCAAGRIPGACRFGRSWMIPAEAVRPHDPRIKDEMPFAKGGFHESPLATTKMLFTPGHIDDALVSLPDNETRTEVLAELAYLRGDYAKAIDAVRDTCAREGSRYHLCALMLTVVSSISMDDYSSFKTCARAIDTLHQRYADDTPVRNVIEFVQSAIALSLYAPDHCPTLIKEEELSGVAPCERTYALMILMEYLNATRNFERMIGIAQATCSLLDGPQVTVTHIYIMILCATAHMAQGREDEARRWLRRAMDSALPDGLTTPFVENMTALRELLVDEARTSYPHELEQILERYDAVWHAWINVHKQVAHDDVSLVLTNREYRVAAYVCNGLSNAAVAESLHYSLATIKDDLRSIYLKLGITRRDQLRPFIL